MRFLIVGAGIAGLATARALMERGVRPTVIACDDGASARGAGILSAQFADAELASLARRSQAIVRRLVSIEACGHAQIATTERGAALLDGLTGVRCEIPDALARSFAAAFRRRIVRAVFRRDDFWVRPRELLDALGRGLRRVRTRVRAVRDGEVVTDDGTMSADRIVLAAGAGSARLVRGLGLRREPARTARLSIGLPAMLHVVETGFYARPDGRRGAVAGDGTSGVIRREALRVFGATARDLGEGSIVTTPDGRPLIRRAGATTWVVAGLGGDGMTLGPAIGERVAALLVDAR